MARPLTEKDTISEQTEEVSIENFGNKNESKRLYKNYIKFQIK